MNFNHHSFRTFLLCIAVSGGAAADATIDAAGIYAESCSVCHGDDGRGAVWGQASLATPPRNFRTEESRRELTRERMIASVTAGRPGTPMPGFGTQLSIEQITAVVDYVRTLPAEWAGDAAQGALLYAQNCIDCHGANGGGDGPRAYFIFPKPRNFNDPATQEYLTPQNLYNGIKHGVVGKEMPAWGKVLSDRQIADLTEYVYRQFIAAGGANPAD
jgi:cbb3-type cytochrome c oxidase subunit III